MGIVDELLSNPYYSGSIWLALVFFCGLLAQRMGLPPLVGFLLGGFAINLTNHNKEPIADIVQTMADVGVMLLLFTIGLKLKIKTLIKPHIWGTALIHMVILVLVFSGVITLLGYLGLRYFAGLDFMSAMMVGFALSFSSTVYIVKTLENSGEMSSVHGKTAIGILVIQDIMAVIFMAISSGKSPSIWVLVLPVWLWILQKLLSYLLDSVEHGEMIQIFGFFATFIAGAFSFYGFGLKPDLGALVMGMLLVSHPRSEELYQKMAEYKDFFLIAFFINVGLVGLPTWKTFSLAAILMPLVIFKGVLFAGILSSFRVQKRSVYLASLSLSNFSEFGLIVGVVGLNMGLLSSDWIVVMALMMSMSFFFASPIQRYSHQILEYFNDLIIKKGDFQIEQVLPGKSNQDKVYVDAPYLVIGMGSIGKPVYDQLNERFPNQVVGLDFDRDKVLDLEKKGYNVYFTDVSFGDVWNCCNVKNIKSVYFTMSDHKINLSALEHIKALKDKTFKIYALTPYSDHAKLYETKGVDFVYNFKERLGADFVFNSLNFEKYGSVV